jgi:hypothetical protein
MVDRREFENFSSLLDAMKLSQAMRSLELDEVRWTEQGIRYRGSAMTAAMSITA